MRNSLDTVNPFVGPRPYSPEEEGRFFGRDREANELVALIVAHPAVLFYAQSGAGKTSLLNARLIPRLAREGFEVFPVARVGGALPGGVSPESIANIYVYHVLSSWMSPQDSPEHLASLSLAAFLRERPHLRDESGEERPRVLLLDQFEELFTLYPHRWPERAVFFRDVNEALEQDRLLRVVFATREDYLPQFDPYAPLLTDRLRGRFRMERLRREAALAAVNGTLVGTGRSFAPGVAEQLVKSLLKIRVEGIGEEITEVVGEFVEPVHLQVVCYELWENIKSHPLGPITETDLREAGDVDRALTGFYEDSLAAVLAEPEVQAAEVSERRLRKWFDVELITETGIRNIVLRNEVTGRTGSLPNVAVDRLAQHYLLRTELRAGGAWVELVHDRLVGPIRASNATWWPKHLSAVQQQAALWEAGGRAQTFLLREDALEEAEQWAAAHQAELVPSEQAFLTASREAIERDRLQQEARSVQGLRRIRRLALGETISFLATIGFYALASKHTGFWCLSGLAALAAILFAVALIFSTAWLRWIEGRQQAARDSEGSKPVAP